MDHYHVFMAVAIFSLIILLSYRIADQKDTEKMSRKHGLRSPDWEGMRKTHVDKVDYELYETPITKANYDTVTTWYNIVDVCAGLEKIGVNYIVAFGTALGVERDGQPIDTDSDFDITVNVHDMPTVRDKLGPELFKRGFKVFKEEHLDRLYELEYPCTIKYARGLHAYGDVFFKDWTGNSKKIWFEYAGVGAYIRVPEDMHLYLDSIYAGWQTPKDEKGKLYITGETEKFHMCRQPFHTSPYHRCRTTLALEEIPKQARISTDQSLIRTGPAKPAIRDWNLIGKYHELNSEINFCLASVPGEDNVVSFVAEGKVNGPYIRCKSEVIDMSVVGTDIYLNTVFGSYKVPDLHEQLSLRWSEPSTGPQ